MRVVLVVLGTIALAFGWLLVSGVPTLGCLGPIGVTPIQCLSGWRDYPGPIPGPGAAELAIIGVGGLTLLAGLLPAHLTASIRRHLALMAIVGTVAGLISTELIRQAGFTGPTSTGELITVVLPSTLGRALAGALLGAVVTTAAFALALRLIGKSATYF